MSMQQRINQHLEDIFNFKTIKGWYREGICPNCNKKSCYTHAESPKIVKCNHVNNCGYEEHVKEICSHLFKDWSKEYPQSKEDPHAAAAAYLAQHRGLDASLLKDKFTQELYRNEQKYPGLISATIRFKISETCYWERLIDRPERFGKQKNNISGSYKGQTWSMHDLDTLAKADEIWLAEGIFNSIALSYTDQISAATLSSQNYPFVLLDQIKDYCKNTLKATSLPKLLWAFDNDKAGKEAAQKFHARAIEEGWQSSAILPVTKKDQDWNDLYQLERLTQEHIKSYRHHGQLLLAASANDAALLIYNFYDQSLNNFHFVHRLKTYWFSINRDKYEKEYQLQIGNSVGAEEAKIEAIKRTAKIEQICNAQINALYFQRNKMTDQSFYYFSIHNGQGEVKETFTPEQLTSRVNFTNRLLSISKGVWWTGTDKQLMSIAQRETDPQSLKEVQTIDFIGYSKDHHTYVFTNHAVHNGKVIHINQHDYYQVGKVDLKTLAKQPDIQLNDESFSAHWWSDNYKINGDKGLILMAWWVGSYFAEQIRHAHASYPFIEFIGQAGAGKTSYLEFLWKLSGSFNPKEGINPNSSTTAAIHRSMAQVSNLPVVFIEGDRKDQSKIAKQKFDWDELKDAFNGRNIRSRGLKTAGNETYEPPFKGTIMISQNDAISASEAILSRTLHISVDTKGHTYAKKLIADRLYKIEPEEACKFITHCLKQEQKILDTYFKKYLEIEKDYHEAGISHIRITKCHAQISAMIDAIAAHVLDDVIDLEEVCSAQDLLMQFAKKRIQDLEADHVLVQQFWDVYEYINSVQNANFKLNHYDEKNSNIAINLNEVYKLAARHFQSLPDINDMRDLLKTSRKYKFVDMNKQVATTNAPVDESHHVKMDVRLRRNVKCWIFSNPYLKTKGR